MGIGNNIWADKLTRTGYYPVVDFVPGFERTFVHGTISGKGIAGKWTGEKRAPKAGEYYISGAIPQVYRAPNDLTQDHAIARLVRIKAEVRIDITERPMLHPRLQITEIGSQGEVCRFVLLENPPSGKGYRPEPSHRYFSTEAERDLAAQHRSNTLYAEEDKS